MAKEQSGPPTLREIAARVGVTAPTVSAVLNNSPRAERFSKATCDKIREVADEMGYAPNYLAQTLKRKHSGLIGVLMFGMDTMYYGRALEGADAAARAAGYELVTASMGFDPARFDRCVQMLAAWRVEGIMLMMSGRPLDEAAVAKLARLRVPVVSGGSRQGDLLAVGAGFDHEAGLLLAKHLLDLGHTRIGMIGADPTNRNHHASERVRAVGEAMAAAGHPLRPDWVIPGGGGHVGVSSGYQTARQLLDHAKDITAVIAMNDVFAIGAMRQINERGIAVPEELSVGSFDDLCLDNTNNEDNRIGVYLSPPLTTVRVPLRALGSGTIQLLLQEIGAETEPGDPYGPELIIRSSTGPAAK